MNIFEIQAQILLHLYDKIIVNHSGRTRVPLEELRKLVHVPLFQSYPITKLETQKLINIDHNDEVLLTHFATAIIESITGGDTTDYEHEEILEKLQSEMVALNAMMVKNKVEKLN